MGNKKPDIYYFRKLVENYVIVGINYSDGQYSEVIIEEHRTIAPMTSDPCYIN